MKIDFSSRRMLIFGIALATILDTVGQLLWKYCVAGLPSDAGLSQAAWGVLHQPLFIVLAVVFLLQLFNWMKVLEHADLSFAQPITSLSYVTVLVLSAFLFGEHIGATKVAGVLCVLGGVWLVSQSESHSEHNPGVRS
ncbi:MAG: EamA family transporter [Betaproteobacteria bacterium]